MDAQQVILQVPISAAARRLEHERSQGRFIPL